jgi:hypothetical protein
MSRIPAWAKKEALYGEKESDRQGKIEASPLSSLLVSPRVLSQK